MSDKVKEALIGEDLFDIVGREVEALKRVAGVLEYPDVLRLEKIAKIYSILSANGRENAKANSLSNLTDDELKQLLDSDGDTDSSS